MAISNLSNVCQIEHFNPNCNTMLKVDIQLPFTVVTSHR